MTVDDDIMAAMTKVYPPTTPKPCVECPWVRTARPGHLGPATAEEWCEIAHGEPPVACHMTIKRVDLEGIGNWEDPAMRQCAGAAIFRANISKTPLNPSIARGEPDRNLVFSWDDEFISHHEGDHDD
jgi:hypothetical protein